MSLQKPVPDNGAPLYRMPQRYSGWNKADPEYGDRLAEALGVDANRVHELAQMTHEERMAATGQQVPARKKGGEVRA